MSIERHPINQCHFGLTVGTLKAERDALLEAAKLGLGRLEMLHPHPEYDLAIKRLRAAIARAERGKP